MGNNITPNISLGIKKKSFTIDGDENRVIYIDPTDMGIIGRMEAFSADIDPLLKSLKDVGEDGLVAKISEVDGILREKINQAFDYDVCSVCVPCGTMLDAVDGKFKFEIVVDALSQVYVDNISSEMQKVTARMAEHTKKYVHK